MSRYCLALVTSGLLGCAVAGSTETTAASAVSSTCQVGYTGLAADLGCPLGGPLPATAPVRSGVYEWTDFDEFITIDVASPKDGSGTWKVDLYSSAETNCNSPFAPDGIQTDGLATIECNAGGRCWFDIDAGALYLWSPTDPNEVSFFHPVASEPVEDNGLEEQRFVWVRPIDASDTPCDCLPQPPPSPTGPSGPAYQGPPTPFNPDPPYSSLESPLVVTFDSAPVQFTGTPIGFDFYADGSQPLLDWILPPAGLLVLDLNGNGTIDTGRELFGTSTLIVATGELAPNGFAALAQYDANHDGKIDVHDPIFTRLLVWTDRNVDGVSQPDELISLAATGIAAIPLHATQLPNDALDAAGTYIGSWTAFDYYPRAVCTREANSGSVSDVWFGANAPPPVIPAVPGEASYGAIGLDASGTLDPAIVQCFLRNGGASAVGAPLDNGSGPLVHTWSTGVAAMQVVRDGSYDWMAIGGSTGGVVQDFSGPIGGSICMHETGRPSAAIVHGWIRDAYFAAGGAASFLGYPIGDEYIDDSLPPPFVQVQQFDGGYIAWDAYRSKFMPHDHNGCDEAYCVAVATCDVRNGRQSCPY